MSSIDFLRGHDLAVYSEDSCPDCSRLERWLELRGVQARTVLISEDPAAADKLERETGKMAVPFILVDGRTWVRGYHLDQPGRFSEPTLLRELRAAVERA
jgi:glutaredoxin